MNSNLTSKKRRITYEELTNSLFFQHPSHNRIVHAVFNPFIVAAIILVATTAYSKIVDGDWVFAIINGCICSMFLSMKMAMVSLQMHGHGVGIIKKGKLSVLGLPTAAVVVFAIILSLIVALVYLSYDTPRESGFERVQILANSMLFGFIMSLLSWRLHSYYTTWYGSEYDARLELKEKKYTDEIIEEKIKLLKKKGILA